MGPVRPSLVAAVPPAAVLRPFGEHLLHAAAADDRTHRRALAPEGLAEAHIVFQAELDGVQAQFLRQHVHHGFHGESDLRVPETLHGAGRDLVGVHGLSFEEEVGEVVEGNPPAGHAAQQRIGLGVMGADVHDDLHVPGGEGAVFAGAELQADQRGVLHMAVKILFPGGNELHGAARLQGQRHADGHDGIHLDARPERPAHGDPLHVDLAQGQLENVAQELANVVNGLSRGPDRDAAVGLRLADDGFGFHLGVVDPSGLEFLFQDEIGLAESLFRISLPDFPGGGDVVFNFPFFIADDNGFVENRRPGLQGFERVKNRGAGFVFDPNEGQGLFGQFLGFGGDRGDCLAHVAGLLRQQEAVFVGGPGDADQTLVVFYFGNVLEGEADRAQALGRARIDFRDPGVGVGAAQNPGMEHAGESDIGGINFLPGHLRKAVFADRLFSNGMIGLLFHGLSDSRKTSNLNKLDDLAKSHRNDGFVKSSRCQARKN